MSNENCIMTDRYKRIQGATLKVLNKNYFVYKGVNTIGRNKTAIINLKNLNISQQHAVIVIVDDSQHFISDLNSSNGTYLLGTQLSPYKLYELTNDVELKFGDLIATYSKVKDSNSTIHLELENMDMTQSMTQTFYGTTTQLINESSFRQTKTGTISTLSDTDLEDIHEAVTQVDIHPPPVTKETNLPPQIIDADIHDAATQVIDYHGASNFTALPNPDDEETQIVLRAPDEYLNHIESVKVCKQDIGDSHDAVTQVVIHHPPVPSETNLSPQMLDMDIHDAPTQVIDYHGATNSNKVLNNDEEETQIVLRAPDEYLDCIESVQPSKQDTQVKMVTSENNEQEEENIHELPTQVVHWPQEFENRNLCNNSEKCRSDVINHSFDQLPKPSNLSTVDESVIEESVLEGRMRVNENSNDSVDFLTLQQPFGNENCDQEKESTFPETQDIGNPRKKPVRKLSSSEDLTEPDSNKIIYNSDSETDLDDDYSNKHKNLKKPLIEADSDTDIEEDRLPGRQNKILDSDSETDIENDKTCDNSLTQTQDVIKPKILSKKSILESDSETDIEDDKEKEPLKIVQDENSSTTEMLNDTDCIPATQDAFAEVFMYKQSKTSKSTSSQNVSSEDSFRLGLTELMVETVEDKDKDGFKNEENNRQDMKLIDDSEDQLSVNKVEDNLISVNDKDGKVVAENEPDELYLLPTQKINTVTQEVSPKHDPYNECTQKLDICNKNDSEQLETKEGKTEATQKLNSGEEKKTDIDDEQAEDFYVMATQELNHEPQFKTPQKKFNFKKKAAVLEGSLSNIFSNNQDDPYMAATQPTNEGKEKNEDFYLQPTQKLDEEKKDLQVQMSQDEDFYMAATQRVHIDLPNASKISESTSVSAKDLNTNPDLKETGEKDQEFYIAPTQPINSNVINKKSGPTTSETVLYNQETQDLQVTKNVMPTNSEKIENSYDEPTQQLNAVGDGQNEDLYVAETQQLNLNPSTSSVLQKPMSKTQDLYNAETERIDLENKNNAEDPYDIATQKLNHIVAENETPSTSTNTVGAKLPINAILGTLQPKKIKEAPDVEVETLSQVDAFVKGTSKTETIRSAKSVSSKITKKETGLSGDQSETLSQIQRFVAEPFENIKKLKTVPKKEIKKKLFKEMGSETSLQSETSSPVDNTKPNKHETSKLNSHGENISEEKLEVFQKPEKCTTRTRAAKSKESEMRTHVSKEECVVVNNTQIAELNISDNSNPDLSHSERDTVKNDVEMSFVLLEAKSTKTRKSQRLNNAAEVKVTVCKNRRSMTTSAIPETSKDIQNNKPSTRKSRRTSTNINNNNLASITENIETTAGGRSKRKFESTTSSEIFEAEKPSKIQKVNKLKKEEQKEINELSSPSTSKRKANSKDSSRDLHNDGSNNDSAISTKRKGNSKKDSEFKSTTSSEIFEVEKPSMVQKVKKEEQKENNELSSTSTSTRKVNSKEPNHDLRNDGSNDSTIATKRKASSKKDSEFKSTTSSEIFEVEKPSKVQKVNKIKKDEQKEIKELSSPSMSKRKANSKKDSSHDLHNDGSNDSTISTKRKTYSKKDSEFKSTTSSEIFEVEKPSKVQKVNKINEEQKEVNEFCSPSTSKRKANSKKDSTHDLDNDGSSDSAISTVSTPSRRGKRNMQIDTITSPEKAKRRQKPKIVFTMLDSPLLESLIKQLGGSIVDSVESSTVLVTEHLKRSQKLLTAIGQGKPICSPEWIRASKKTNEFLDPWDFILLDKEAEGKWDFSLKESLTRANNEKLLSNYTFQLMVNNAADVLKGAIEACGGKCVPRHPAKHTEGFFVVVASPENRTKYVRIKKQHPHVTVVEPEAIFDGVLRQDLRLGRHLLT